MKKISITLALSLVLVLAFTACGGGGTGAAIDNNAGGDNANTGQKYVMRVGCAAVEPSHPAVFLKEFEKALESKTDQIDVQVYPGNQLGTNVQIITGLQNNTVQAAVFPTSFFAPFIPEYNLLDLPGVFMEEELFFNMLKDRKATPNLNAAVEKKGMYAASYLYPHPQITIYDREIKSFSDLKGLKVRCHDSEIKQAELQAVGSIPMSMSTADVPLALQQGTINGMQSDVIFINGNKLYQSAKYVTNLPNYQTCNVCMISKPFLDSLPGDLRQLVLDTADEVNENIMVDYIKEFMVKSYEMIKNDGGVIVDVGEDVIRQYNEAARPVGEQFISKHPEMRPIYDELMSYVESH